MKEIFKQLLTPNYFRGHLVMLSSFIAGNIYFVFLLAGFSAALGLVSGIITAPIGFFTGAATLYIVRKVVNLEFRGLRVEAENKNIKLNYLPEVGSENLFQTSKDLYLRRDSWKAVLVSLAKFPIGIASLIFITAYLSISLSLLASPILHRYIEMQFHDLILNTPLELTVAVIGGLILFILGAQITEMVSWLYLKLNSFVEKKLV